MGAWGAGLFESDDDLDLASDISYAAGMNLERPESKKSNGKGTAFTIRALNDGLFDKFFQQYQKPQDPNTFYLHSNKYYLVILTALAVRLGANVSEEQKSCIRAIVKSAGLFKEGIVQVQRALNEYKNGKAYKFISPGVCEQAPFNGSFQLMNHLGARYHEEDIATPDTAAVMMNASQGLSICRDCNKLEMLVPPGQRFKRCAKCKKATYCDRDCQKKDWKIHKDVCVAHDSNVAAKVGSEGAQQSQDA